MSPEHRSRLSEVRKGKPLTSAQQEQLRRLHKSRKEKPRTPLAPEHRARISESMKGRQVSPETRQRMSEAAQKRQKGKQLSPEHREALRRAWERRKQRQKEPQIVFDANSQPQ